MNAHTPPPATDAVEYLWRGALAMLRPPPSLVLSKWSEQNIRLPEGKSARPGRFRNWPYMVEIIDSFGDMEIERVSVIKAARIGYTKGMMAAIGATAATDPCPQILLVPRDEDVQGFAEDEVEPVFDASPALQDILRKGKNGRSRMDRKDFVGGGSLKLLSARSPANLRRHDAKKLWIDEADAMELTKEGDPILLAEKRTQSFPDRKIIQGSTPTEEGLSVIDRAYKESDQRIFKVPCPHCGHRFELLWQHIEFRDDPTKPYALCPSGNGCVIHERHKPFMCENGEWEAQRPEVEGHRGYRINALVSLLPNASWPKLVEEYRKAKKEGPASLQVFYNTVLALPWKTSIGSISAELLAARVESFGVTGTRADIPREVVLITCGADVQDDRIEATLMGWPLHGAPYVLGHFVFSGNTLDDWVWQEFDSFLKRRWRHPNGWVIGIEGTAVDSGGREGRTQKAYDWTGPKMFRKIYAIKGVEGPRPIWKKAEKTKGGARVYIVRIDQAKTEILERLGRDPYPHQLHGERDPHAIHLSEELEEEWFEQATGESRRIRYVRNRAVIEFAPKKSGQRVEALDCLVYGWAVRFSAPVLAIDLQERAARRPPEPGAQKEAPKAPNAGDWASMFNS